MVAGFDVPPGAGERFQVVDEISMAREVAGKREGIRRQTSLLARPVHVTFENLADRLGTQQVPTLNLILRADVRGSIEAILKELEKLEHPEVVSASCRHRLAGSVRLTSSWPTLPMPL
jgi:translation initiation factor IF-2